MEGLPAKIEAAASRLRGQIARTPLLECTSLNDQLGLRVLVKAESLQKTGSFKVRGALNFLALASANTNSRFVAYSSGNHAQGLAYAARTFGSHATVLMPADAPVRKVAGTRALGADVELLDDFFGGRQQRVEELVAEGATFVPPFDDEAIVAGQGTVGLEIAEQAAGLSVSPDVLVCPISGGGLFSGAATAVRQALPGSSLLAVEPSGFDDFARSVASGSRIANSGGFETICDGLRTPVPGHIPFEIVRKLNPAFTTVTDEACRSAVGTLFDHFNIVAEPSGAAALAALSQHAPHLRGKTAVIIVSGGNIDPSLFIDILKSHSAGGQPTMKEITL